MVELQFSHFQYCGGKAVVANGGYVHMFCGKWWICSLVFWQMVDIIMW